MKICALAVTFLGISLALAVNAAQKDAAPQKHASILAQKLVDNAHAKHPETAEVGIAVVGSTGCSTIASTDNKDIGEKCEKEDSEPIQTGKPHVEKEGKNFDVTLPLHDSSGKIVGSVGMELPPNSGETQDAVVKRATAIAKGIEPDIPSKASLTEPF